MGKVNTKYLITFRLPGFLDGVVRDGWMEFADRLPARGAGAHAAEFRAGVPCLFRSMCRRSHSWRGKKRIWGRASSIWRATSVPAWELRPSARCCRRRTQFHQAQLMEHVNSLSSAYHNLITGTQAKLVLVGSYGAHRSGGPGVRNESTARCSDRRRCWRFIDNFHMLGIVFLLVIPPLMLLKRPPKGAAAPVH